MKVRECMTANVRTAQQSDTVQHAAQLMRDTHIGFLPIVNLGGAPVGAITDRDIAVRIVAEGKPLTTHVSEVMSQTLHRIDEEAPVEEAVRLMKEQNIGRLVVTNALNHVVGVFSLGDAAVALEDGITGNVVMEAVGRHKMAEASVPPILRV